MSYVYDTTAKTAQVTASSTARQLHDNIQSTFAGSTYMQYLIPDSGSILSALYIFQNGWTFLGDHGLQSSGLSVAAGGSGYSVGDVLTVTGGSGTGGTVIVATLSGSAVATVTLSSAGNGYTTTTGAATTGGHGTGCTITFTATNAATSVNYMTTGGWQDSTGNDKWTNVQAISGNNFTGIQTYFGQAGSIINAVSTGLPNQLLKVRSAGNDIGSQSYTLYQRTQGKLYSQFTTTASAGGVDSIPLSIGTDPLITISDGTLSGYSDLSINWATIYRSAFDGASTTNYTLNGSLSSGTTTITVNESIDSSVPSSGSFAIGNAITQEVVTYTGKTTHTFTGCTRSQYRTTAPGTWASGTALSTATAQYATQIVTTSSARRLTEAYNWIQYELRQSSDIDGLHGGHLGQLTNALVSMPSTTSITTSQGIWVEGFSSADANIITYTDSSGTTHTPPLTVPVLINFSASVASASGQVAVFGLTTTGLNDSTYTPADIASTIINTAASGTSASTTLVYSSDIPVRVIVRAPGLQQFSLYTTITSSGLSVTAQNPSDSTY